MLNWSYLAVHIVIEVKQLVMWTESNLGLDRKPMTDQVEMCSTLNVRLPGGKRLPKVKKI